MITNLPHSKVNTQQGFCDSCKKMQRVRGLIQFKSRIYCYKCYLNAVNEYLYHKYPELAPKALKMRVDKLVKEGKC